MENRFVLHPSVTSYLDKISANELEKTNYPNPIKDQLGICYKAPLIWREYCYVYLFIPVEFPYCLPKILIDQEHLKKERLIPHVDYRGFVCIAPEDSTVNSSSPVRLIQVCFNEVQQLLNKKYYSSKIFAIIEPEIRAYWELGAKANILISSEGLLEKDIFPAYKDLKKDGLLYIKPLQDENKKIEYICLRSCISPDDAMELIKSNPDITPVIQGAHQNNLNEFYEINKYRFKPSVKILFMVSIINCLKDVHLCLLLNRKNKRREFEHSNSLELLAKKIKHITENKKEAHIAVNTQISTIRRLCKRASGQIPEDIQCINPNLKFAFLGCGSLGGYIIDLLSRQGFKNFCIFDNERLGIENLLRHVLSPSDLHQFKAGSIKRLLEIKVTGLSSRA